MPIRRPMPPSQPSGSTGGSRPGTDKGYAPQLAAPGSRGQDARFDVSGLPQVRPGVYRDAAGVEYDSGGLALGPRPLFNDGLPAADADYQNWWAQNPGGPGSGGPGGPGGSNILSNPYYQQVLAAINGAGASDAASRRTGIQQALIAFGLVPENFNDKYGDVDALTRSLADKNTTSGLSTRARLLQSFSDTNRTDLRNLNARGLRRSGTRGYKLRRNQLAFDQQNTDALGQLLGYSGSLYSQFAQNEYQRALQLAEAARFASTQVDPGGGDNSQGEGIPQWFPNDSGFYDYRDIFLNPQETFARRQSVAPYRAAVPYTPRTTRPSTGTNAASPPVTYRGTGGGGVFRSM